MFGYLILTILVFTLVAYFVGSSAGRRFVAEGNKNHSLPGYHPGSISAIDSATTDRQEYP